MSPVGRPKIRPVRVDPEWKDGRYLYTLRMSVVDCEKILSVIDWAVLYKKTPLDSKRERFELSLIVSPIPTFPRQVYHHPRRRRSSRAR